MVVSRLDSGDVWLTSKAWSCCCDDWSCEEYCWSQSRLALTRFGPPTPANMTGIICGGMPPCIDSRNMDCSTRLRSNLSVSWRVFSSSCLRLSSSAFVDNQLRMESSAPCHWLGGAGIASKVWLCIGGGGLPGSGNVSAAGGGKPRCEVDME